MGALNWLNRLRKNESGNIIAVTAAAMPMFVGSAGLAVDTIQLSLAKRELQRAADSGAIAGAYSMSQRRTTAQITASVTADLAKNPHDPFVTGSPVVTPGARAGFRQAVHVSLRAERTLPFLQVFTDEPATIAAEATAALVATGRYCMVSLYNGTDPGITLNGNATVKLGCGMVANSRSASSIQTGGTQSWIEATPIGSVGGLDGENNNFDGSPTSTATAQLVPYSAPQADPFASLPNPEPCTSTAGPLTVANNQVRTLTLSDMEQCWSSVSIPSNGTIIIPASAGGTQLRVWGGNVEINGRLNMSGTGGTTIVMSGPPNAAGTGLTVGTLSMHAQAGLSLSAPTEGSLADIVFYRDRRAALSTITVRGGGSSTLKGAFYSPTSNFDYAGNAGFIAECLSLVGQKIHFSGTSDLDNECDDDSDILPVSGSIVRLVE